MSWFSTLLGLVTAHHEQTRRTLSSMQPLVEFVPVSEHEWLVADDETVLGVVEEHAGDFEAVIGDSSAWHPHFDSLAGAELYFSEYAFALHLGRD